MTLVVAVEVVMEELGGTFDEMMADLTVFEDILGFGWA